MAQSSPRIGDSDARTQLAVLVLGFVLPLLVTRLFASIGLAPHPSGEHVRAGVNDGYFARWRGRRNPYRALDRRRTIRRWEPDVRRFGYSLVDTAMAADLSLPAQSASPNANRR